MGKNNTNEKGRQYRQYTPWHVYFGYALERFISKEDMEIRVFEKLGTLPLEADVIIIKKKTTKDLTEKYPDLKFLIPYLGKYTVIEYKSPLDRLTYGDFDKGRAYLNLAKEKYNIKYDIDINLIFLCSAFENDYFKYVKANGYSCNKIEDGIYGHKSEKGSDIYWINLKEIGEKDPGNVFRLFSSMKNNTNIPIKEIRNIELLTDLFSHIFFKKEDIMQGLQLRQRKEFDNTMESFKTMFLSNLSPEERLKGLGPEERLKGLSPEDMKKIKEYLEKT